MTNIGSGKKTAIGLFVDGLQIKFAKLSRKGNSILIDELKSATLVTKLSEHPTQETDDTFSDSLSHTFAIDSEKAEAETTEDNNAVLLGLLAQYKPKSYSLGYSISEPGVFYYTLENDFGLKGNQLKEKVYDEIKKIRTTQPPADAIDVFYSSDRNLMCVVREEGLSLIRSINEIKTFLHNKIPKIPLIDTSDISLLNLARANYGFAPDEISVIVYIGVDFSRLIFMKGAEFYHFAPSLGEGYDSFNVQNTIYSRLLLEQDNLGIPRIDRILLAGESKRIALDEFLHYQLPEVEIQYLNTPYLDSSGIPYEIQEQIPEYAVPIATAWKILEENNPAFYPTNLLPENIREEQRVFKLAWHGYLLLIAMFISTFYFTFRISELNSVNIARIDILQQKNIQLEENRKLQEQIIDLENQISKYHTALSVYDSIVPGYNKWSNTLEHLTQSVNDINSLWITDFKTIEKGRLAFTGFSIFRARIPRMTTIYENVTLSKVLQTEIREKTLFSFELIVPPADDPDAGKLSLEINESFNDDGNE